METVGDEQLVWSVYELVRTDDVLQQGDLIKFDDVQTSHKYGIVVTADCDLGKRKHSRLVTLVPLMSVENIVCLCLAYDSFEQHADLLKQFCKKHLGIEEATTDPQFLGKVKSYVLAGIAERKVELAARAISHEQLDLTISDVRLLIEELGISWSKTLVKFQQQIGSRGDLLRLAKPPLTPANVRVAWLRSMWQEQISEIALRTSEAASKKGVRVARLNSPYRYRLTQMLGQVFADIGLPDLSPAPIADDFKGFSL